MTLIQDPATVKAEMERLELWKTFERTGKPVRFACNPVTRETFLPPSPSEAWRE